MTRLICIRPPSCPRGSTFSLTHFLRRRLPLALRLHAPPYARFLRFNFLFHDLPPSLSRPILSPALAHVRPSFCAVVFSRQCPRARRPTRPWSRRRPPLSPAALSPPPPSPTSHTRARTHPSDNLPTLPPPLSPFSPSTPPHTHTSAPFPTTRTTTSFMCVLRFRGSPLGGLSSTFSSSSASVSSDLRTLLPLPHPLLLCMCITYDRSRSTLLHIITFRCAEDRSGCMT